MAEKATLPPKKNMEHRERPYLRIRKRRLYEFPPPFWSSSSAHVGEDVTSVLHEPEAKKDEEKGLPDVSTIEISAHSTCNTCNVSFESHFELREHCQSDRHSNNLRRKLKNKPPLSEEEFEQVCDNLSDGSLSGSGEEESDEEEERMVKRRAKQNVKLQFDDPGIDGSFVIVYRVALPDETSLKSFENLGSWAVIMTGSGHFSAAIWDEAGNMLKNKSFHRYTTRRKQGGTQSAADASKTIKSAGSTLRRYGEQALRQEVQQLLLSWSAEFANVQCVFMRSGKRDKRDLLFGWDASPLIECREKGICRNIPFPTRRATLKEVTRVYEQLSTAILSPVSLIAAEVPELEVETKPKPAKPSSAKSSHKPREPVEKGTAHLKKREPVPDIPVTGAPELDAGHVQLISDIAENKLDAVQQRIADSPELKSAELGPEYFKSHEKLKPITHGLGVVCIAAAFGSLDVLEWLMLEKAPLQVGCSPYMVTKAKRVRTYLRKFWAQHPDLHDYAAAGIPNPLSEADAAASAEKERQKRKRERDKKNEKKNEKTFLTGVASKPQAERMRELRAAAAEARAAEAEARGRVSGICVVCKKSLSGIVPFERLTFKYCSLDHVQKHRKALNE